MRLMTSDLFPHCRIILRLLFGCTWNWPCMGSLESECQRGKNPRSLAKKLFLIQSPEDVGLREGGGGSTPPSDASLAATDDLDDHEEDEAQASCEQVAHWVSTHILPSSSGAPRTSTEVAHYLGAQLPTTVLCR